MATHQSFIDHVLDQAELGDALTFRKMFGEYALYLDGKVVAFACDNSLFIKPGPAAQALEPELPQGPPYPGARDYPIADELLDSPEAFEGVVGGDVGRAASAQAEEAARSARCHRRFGEFDHHGKKAANFQHVVRERLSALRQEGGEEGRTKAEVDEIIAWLTGYERRGACGRAIDAEVDFETFFAEAPSNDPKAGLITGLVCGVRVEDVPRPADAEDSLPRQARRRARQGEEDGEHPPRSSSAAQFLFQTVRPSPRTFETFRL